VLERVLPGYFGMLRRTVVSNNHAESKAEVSFFFIPIFALWGFEYPPLRYPERFDASSRYLKYPSLSNWSTMLVSMNEAGSAAAAFGVVLPMARRVFLMDSDLGLGFRSAHLAKIW
jgi:hypothetical protein